MVAFCSWAIKTWLENTFCLWQSVSLLPFPADYSSNTAWRHGISNPSETATLEIVKWPTNAEKITPIVENKPLIYQPKEAMGSPEKAGQCCHFQSDWHWAVSLHSTVHDSALVANTGSSVTAAVQSKIVWKHEWMIWSTKKSDAQSEWRLPLHEEDARWVDRWQTMRQANWLLANN